MANTTHKERNWRTVLAIGKQWILDGVPSVHEAAHVKHSSAYAMGPFPPSKYEKMELMCMKSFRSCSTEHSPKPSHWDVRVRTPHIGLSKNKLNHVPWKGIHCWCFFSLKK